mmetsp:Transcript_27185/g.36326  ORF Transcript_27185/g.36326 Transcript_27185/m.36326 type:complete len:100 (-) Transcript_27185:54-353(-)
MKEPVLIESGQTFERETISRYFEIQQSSYERHLEGDDETQIDDFLKCPITNRPVNPIVMIPNRRIKAHIARFIEGNPWAYNFDPHVSYRDIPLDLALDE